MHTNNTRQAELLFSEFHQVDVVFFGKRHALVWLGSGQKKSCHSFKKQHRSKWPQSSHLHRRCLGHANARLGVGVAPRSGGKCQLIGAVPGAGRPFLGPHLTRKLGGGFTAGPNAVLSGAREALRRSALPLCDIVAG